MNNSFFSIESPLYKLMVKLLDIIKLNFLWLICSIPVITMGAATTAAFYTGFRIDKDKDAYIAAPFIREFKANFKQGSIIGIIQMLIIYVIYIDFRLSAAAGKKRLVYMAAGIVAIFLAFLHFIYVYALLARYENTIMNTFRNSFSICIKFFPKTIGLLLLVLMECAIFLWNFTTMFVGFFIGPACIVLTICKFVMPMFEKIEAESTADKDM
ncbi:MAG: DUF624 domain-containing protein [Lachnospiraceae bacterium]